tara:strand:- start:58 stop:402 length:345 start_codon:yes stop_codon:yes gene_type:complete
MANVYRNANYKLATTNLTTVYTCPDNSRAIIKKIHTINAGSGNHAIEAFLFDSSDGVTYQFAQHSINSGTSQAVGDGTFILEENDSLKLQAVGSNSGDHFQGTIAILEINREDL